MQEDYLKHAKQILEIIGTPFNEPILKKENLNLMKLYNHSYLNKIDLLFLKSLNKNGLLDGLEDALKIQKNRKQLQQQTWERTVDVLNEIDVKYAVIKSIFPFEAVPNDVDIIIFGKEKEYKKAIQQLQKNEFKVLEEASLETNLIDTTTKNAIFPVNGVNLSYKIDDTITKIQNYYPVNEIDVYKEIGASKLVYMNKDKLYKYLENIKIGNRVVSGFKPHVEMIISMFHTIYPERIYTLLIHLLILDTIKKMNSEDYNEFLIICEEQKIKKGISIVLDITEKIQEDFFGEVPKEVKKLHSLIGKRKQITLNKVPYVYPKNNILTALTEKLGEKKFLKSSFKQFGYLFNPKATKFIIKESRNRAKRDTY
jgi:hypothetical protein